jgi:hypothetical protein
VHLVDEHVRDAAERGVGLEPAQQHASGAEEQLRRRRRDALAAHRVAHCAGAAPLAALGSDALGDADGGDAARLGDDDRHALSRAMCLLQDVLRDLVSSK